MGMLRGILFLENEPLSLDMLAEKTGYSKTTVRTNMHYLENIGMAVRIVGPSGKQHRYRQYRYALVTDTEALKLVLVSALNDEVHSTLQALNQVERNLEAHSAEAEKMSAIMGKTRQFYEEMDKFMELMSQYTLKEFIEIQESKKK